MNGHELCGERGCNMYRHKTLQQGGSCKYYFLFMKAFFRNVFFLLGFLPCLIYAQELQPLKLRTGTFLPENNIAKGTFSKIKINSALFEHTYYVIISFQKLPTEETKKQLELNGVRLVRYIAANTYSATINATSNFSFSNKFNIAGINVLPVSFKIDPSLKDKGAILRNPSSLISVYYYSTVDKTTIEQTLQQAGALVVRTKFDKPGLLFVKTSPSQTGSIASLPFVEYVAPQVINDKPLNYNNNAAQGNAALSYNGIGGKNLTGKNVTVGVGDNADISSHIDFTGRLINRTPAPYQYHGTHTTGTTGGAGLVNPKYKGMAPEATLISQYFSDIIVNAPLYLSDNNLTLTNNSYYTGADSCAGDDAYDAISNYVDEQSVANDKILHVIAAGNDGALSCTVYPASFATIKSGLQCAKDALTVGAIDNASNTIGSFSSRGPVADGRLKPEIVAGGVGVISTFPYNGYGSSNGTSMAAPTVTGSLALLTQRYKQLNGNANPPAYLLKALVCNSAIDKGNAGPDFTYGFGNLNTRKAVEDLEANNYFINNISNGATNQQTINVPAGAKQLRVMLYWPDVAAAPNAITTLVNDLDLVVTEPNSTNHLPLVLNSSPAGVNNVATEGADHTNNIEQVVINNPAAGSYVISVSGYAIPLGPQPYVVTYEINNPVINVDYPYGGEKWVPGETEIIRWNAFDDDTNPFTIEYSSDNGATWSIINNNVAATQRNYSWTVPSAATNTALIRISRNNTSVTAQSSFNFCVLGQPVVTATNPCNGYMQLDWPAIPSATDYDIYMLIGDSMKVIGATSSNTYLITGLNTATKTWASVSAKNGTVDGRRSVAVSMIPNGGACTLSAFDNDFKAVSIIQPVTGREFTSTSLLAAKPISVQIKNLDNAASSGSFTVSYSINGSAPVTETDNTIIAAGGTITHTFAQQPILPGPFTDSIKVWVTNAGDLQHDNDTAFAIVKLLSNPAVSLPSSEDFETAYDSSYITKTSGLAGLDDIDFTTSTVYGRARTFINTGFANSGTRAVTLDQSPTIGAYTSDSLIFTKNLSLYDTASDQLRLDFFYKNSGQTNLPGNKVWLRGSDTSNWILAYDLYANEGAPGDYVKSKSIAINDLLSSATPKQNVSSSFQVKFGEEGLASANAPYPDDDLDNGYTFDDIKISKAVNDVAAVKIVSPSASGCALTDHTAITMEVKNYSNATINNVQVGYKINNNAAVIESIASLTAGQVLDYTFVATADMSAYIDYNINAWVNYPPDNYSSNDSISDYTLHASPLINIFPYLEGFETNDGNWYTGGTHSSWQWGTPAKTIINKAANGSHAWVTSLSGNYNNDELSYLYSPCFDLSSLAKPVLSFSHIFKMEDNCDCDYHWMEYSTDGGVTWQKLGAVGSGTNWYDNSTYQRWQKSKTKWEVSSIDIPTNASNVRFRFVLNSDPAGNYEGVGIDDIHIFDKAPVYVGADTTLPSQNVSGNNWIDFSVNGNRIASVNPNGQDLGATAVSVYFNNGPVRTSNNQYYLDRNIVIQPTNQPMANVGVRYYFTDSEANKLINATGCPACSSINDAYDAGVTKFSGAPSEENGTLADNTTGFYNFIIPDSVSIIPNDNGYYGEFNVNSFSEFWIDSGGPSGLSPLLITLADFTAAKYNNSAKLNWTTVRESNGNEFVIERSSNGSDFTDIGKVNASGNNSGNNYQFIDATPMPGINYYRLKLIDNSNNITYSVVRQLNFNEVSPIKVFPNPVTQGTLTVSTTEECMHIELLNILGQRLKTFATSGFVNNITIGKLPKGVYQLKIFTRTDTKTVSINVE